MQDLTTGSVTRHLLKTTGFMLVTMVFQTLYFLVDLYWVGHLGKEAVAAVSVAGNLTFIVLAATQMLSVGTTTLVSHAAGRKDRERAIFAANQSQGLGIACGLLFLAVAMAVREQYATALGADPETRRLAADYLLWFIPAMALQFPMVSMSAALRGTGNFKPGMIVQTSTVIINIIGAPLLIFGVGTGRPLGVKGAALASFIALIIGTAWLALYFRGTEAYLHFRPREWKPHMREWAGMLKVGLPAGAHHVLRPRLRRHGARHDAVADAGVRAAMDLVSVCGVDLDAPRRELCAPPARIPPAPGVGVRSRFSQPSEKIEI